MSTADSAVHIAGRVGRLDAMMQLSQPERAKSCLELLQHLLLRFPYRTKFANHKLIS